MHDHDRTTVVREGGGTSMVAIVAILILLILALMVFFSVAFGADFLPRIFNINVNPPAQQPAPDININPPPQQPPVQQPPVQQPPPQPKPYSFLQHEPASLFA